MFLEKKRQYCSFESLKEIPSKIIPNPFRNESYQIQPNSGCVQHMEPIQLGGSVLFLCASFIYSRHVGSIIKTPQFAMSISISSKTLSTDPHKASSVWLSVGRNFRKRSWELTQMLADQHVPHLAWSQQWLRSILPFLLRTPHMFWKKDMRVSLHLHLHISLCETSERDQTRWLTPEYPDNSHYQFGQKCHWSL